jgi:hypothetical protein
MGRGRKNAKASSRAKRLRNAVKETAAKQQYRAIHLDYYPSMPLGLAGFRELILRPAGRPPPLSDHFIPVLIG